MKKLFILLLALALLLSLAACSPNPNPTGSTPPQSTQNPTGSQSPADPGSSFVFTYNSTEIRLHADMAPILAALGQPISYTESASCAFDGKDKTYNYSSFCLTTYPQGEKDLVFSFWFVDDSVTTSEGLYIGAPQAMAETACGADSYNGINAYVKKLGDTRMTVIITDGLISSIQYTVLLT